MSASAASQWAMLKDALRDALTVHPGYRVAQALFTTYAFEPEFFESAVVPLLLPEGDEGLSLHSTLRRLQLESVLRESPMDIDVYFDARIVVPGCPFLPYDMVPVRVDGEFHGKVILLRLEDEAGKVLCILGAGSANLTKAGWWENLEAWYFTPAFDPKHTPVGILPGIRALLDLLGRKTRLGRAGRVLQTTFENARARLSVTSPEFGVFEPDGNHFLDWLHQRADGGGKKSRLEVISPYFAESGHADLVDALRDAIGVASLGVWLPLDPWQSGGTVALVQKECYGALKEAENVHWCRMRDPELAKARDPGTTPRFLHAKLIRLPGKFCFMGSVNFSHKAFHHNFEAGFLFPDDSGPWLEDLEQEPNRFVNPQSEASSHDAVDDGLPEVSAWFSWKTHALNLEYVPKARGKAALPDSVRLLRSHGEVSGVAMPLPGQRRLSADHPLVKDLQSNPWIKLGLPGNKIGLAWVQQTDLEFRPPPVALKPDLQRVLEMWRCLKAGKKGSHPIVDLTDLEISLTRGGAGGEEPPVGAPKRDLFGEMSNVHSGFHLLRLLLRDQPDRREYYFSAPRPDSLRTVLAQIRAEVEGGPEDPVLLWVMLQWAIQICGDHKDLPAANAARKQARQLVDHLNNTKAFAELGEKFLAWSGLMFQCQPGKERQAARRLKPQDEGMT